MFPLMDRKKHKLLKELMRGKGDEGKTRVGIGSKVQESRGLCDAFLLFGDYRMFLPFVWEH